MSTTYPSDLLDAEAEWECVQRYLPALHNTADLACTGYAASSTPSSTPSSTSCAQGFAWWRFLPSNFPSLADGVRPFLRFRLQGIWHRLYSARHRAERERADREAELSAAIKDNGRREQQVDYHL